MILANNEPVPPMLNPRSEEFDAELYNLVYKEKNLLKYLNQALNHAPWEEIIRGEFSGRLHAWSGWTLEEHVFMRGMVNTLEFHPGVTDVKGPTAVEIPWQELPHDDDEQFEKDEVDPVKYELKFFGKPTTVEFHVSYGSHYDVFVK